MSTNSTRQPKWLPDNDEGLHAYIVTSKSWGESWDRIEYAANLADAKRKHGWTRMAHTTVTVRRATVDDAHLAGQQQP